MGAFQQTRIIMSSNTRILIVFDSEGGNTYRLAQRIGRGVEAQHNAEAILRAVPKVSARTEACDPNVPTTGAPYVDVNDLAACDGLILGSPTRFGNMSASLKYFLDQTTSDWFAGNLAGKPAGLFTSTGSMHGGQEATLLSMSIPLLHHGMIICGIPYSHPELMQTERGGTPYGASHVSGEAGDWHLTETEGALAEILGKRVATLAAKLK